MTDTNGKCRHGGAIVWAAAVLGAAIVVGAVAQGGVYKLHKPANGGTYRINRLTGEVCLPHREYDPRGNYLSRSWDCIQGRRRVPLPEPWPNTLSDEDRKRLLEEMRRYKEGGATEPESTDDGR